MVTMKTTQQQSIEISCLQQDYGSIRMDPSSGLSALIESMQRQGQLVPVVVLNMPSDQPRWLLLDGYRRVKAAASLGLDTVNAEIWDCTIPEALLRLLAEQSSRAWDKIEEAQLLVELKESHGYSLHQIAAQINRHVSYVSRRIQLVDQLPNWLLSAITNRHLSLWSASRCLAPLARANEEHAQKLLKHIMATPVSTRELNDFFQSYQSAHSAQRHKMIEHPDLFFKAKKNIEQKKLDDKLSTGPEGIWYSQMKNISEQLAQQLNQLPKVFYDKQDQKVFKSLINTFNEVKNHFSNLDNKLQEIIHARKT